ncbi:MAG: esterase [Clostridia bacterium]|nr:esterase [Clostridia bacterium]
MDYVKVISKGSYHIGGDKYVISGEEPYMLEYWPGGPVAPYDPNGEFQGGQMYVQYTRIADPVVPYPVCLIHGGGGTGALWESTQSGEPGWEFDFLKNGFNVNVSDGCERGRASWAQFPQINSTPPIFCSYDERWTIYRLGPKYKVAFEGSRFDASKYDFFMKQQVPRWTSSIAMSQKSYDEYVGSMTDGCILLAHSQGGLFTLPAALKHPENVKGIILVESSSTLDVNKTDCSALLGIPFLHVYGDFLEEEHHIDGYNWAGNTAYFGTMRNLHNYINENGGDSTWLHLPEIGIYGNTHAMMVEDNSREIADIISNWIKEHVK